MKIIKFILYTIILIILLGFLPSQAAESGFSTEPLPEEKKEKVLNNINVTLITDEPKDLGICCFDVNEDEMIAIGFEDSNDKYVSVYSSKGEFCYGYKFSSSGSFGVEWVQQCLNIYLVRSDILLSLDENAGIIEINKVENTTENSIYYRKVINASTKSVGDKTFKSENDFGIFNIFTVYDSKLTAYDADSTASVIYDAGNEIIKRTIVICVTAFIIFLIIVLIVIDNYKRKNNHNIEEVSV